MKLFDRLALLVRADAHGVMDQLEERTLLLKQNLRDAEIELARKRARVADLEEEERRLREGAARQIAGIAALDEDVELALAGGKEDLARFAIKRLLPRREALRTLEGRIGQIAETRGRLAERLEEQERDFEELKTRVRARLVQARAEEAIPDAAPPPVADEEIELELLRRRGVQEAAQQEPGGPR